LIGVHATHLQAELDVLTRIEKRKQRQRLPHHRRVALVRFHVVHHPAIKPDLALARCFKPGQHAQGRGLAAARRAHDGDELALADFQVHLLDGNEVAKALHHLVEHHQWLAHAAPCFMDSGLPAP
jgi:hypothetical protein